MILIGGIETASIVEVAAVDKKRGLLSTDVSHVSKPKDIEDDGVQTNKCILLCSNCHGEMHDGLIALERP